MTSFAKNRGEKNDLALKNIFLVVEGVPLNADNRVSAATSWSDGRLPHEQRLILIVFDILPEAKKNNRINGLMVTA